MILNGIVYEDSIELFIDELSALAGEELDWGQRKALLEDLRNTDSDSDPPSLLDHTFYGTNKIQAKFGLDPNAGHLSYDLEVEDSNAAQEIETLTKFML